MTHHNPLLRSFNAPLQPLQRLSRVALVAGLALATAGAVPAAPHAIPREKVLEVRVIRVVDGDTLVVAAADSLNFKVRLHGIDAPECGMPFGLEAQRHLESLVLGTTVQLMNRGPDRYHRVVAGVTVGGRDVSLAMLGAGLAWHDERFHKPQRDRSWGVYRTARQLALASGRGLWMQNSPTPPWLWRRELANSASRVRCSGPTAAPLRRHIPTSHALRGRT